MAPHPWALAAPLSAILLGGCGGVLDPHGPVGAANKLIMLNALAIMLAIVVPTIIAALAFAWWFRSSNRKARYRPDFVYSGRIEIIVWSIPILVVLFLGGVIWVGSHELDPARPLPSKVPPLEVQVVSLDWKWLFIFPAQGVASVNELAVPAGVPVRFSLTSASVMNTFFVPQLGSMIYTMNGMVTKLHLQADRPGAFHGLSGHFSGDGFSNMGFTLRAMPTGGFEQWVTQVRRAGPVLDRAAYDRLALQSTTRPFAYRAIDPSLFQAVATQHIPPAAGPAEGRAGPDVSPRSEQ